MVNPSLRNMHNELIKDLGERELIRRIAQFMPKDQTSDDCAFIKLKKNNLLINTDLLVEKTHFTNETISPLDLGWKAVTANLSDLISSGCDEIIGIKIGLVLTRETEWSWVKNLYEGINLALCKYGGLILGGDCSRGSERTIAITAFGTQGELILRRYFSSPQEIILTTGIHGLSKFGFDIKKNKISKKDLLNKSILIQDSLNAFCRPKPKFKIINKTNLKFGIHIDSGINRLGINYNYVSKNIFSCQKLKIVISHLASADEYSNTFNTSQRSRFDKTIKNFKRKDIIFSLANSNGSILSNKFRYDMIRPGIGLYGGNNKNIKLSKKLKPVLTFCGKIIQIKMINKNEFIGYNQTFKTKKTMRVAVIGVGYADGVPRKLSNNGLVYYKSSKFKILGTQ